MMRPGLFLKSMVLVLPSSCWLLTGSFIRAGLFCWVGCLCFLLIVLFLYISLFLVEVCYECFGVCYKYGE